MQGIPGVKIAAFYIFIHFIEHLWNETVCNIQSKNIAMQKLF